MQKSVEERIAALESGINRVVKMQTCVFKLVQAEHRISTFINQREWDATSLKDSVESTHQYMNYSLTFMFGGVATWGISFSMLYAYSTTHNLVASVMTILTFIVGCISYFLAVRYNRLANRQRETTMNEFRQAQSLNVTEQAAALDNELTQVLAEWKELVPDDSASEPESEH